MRQDLTTVTEIAQLLVKTTMTDNRSFETQIKQEMRVILIEELSEAGASGKKQDSTSLWHSLRNSVQNLFKGVYQNYEAATVDYILSVTSQETDEFDL